MYDDPWGPMVLGAVLLFAFASIFASGLVKLLTNEAVVGSFR
jgi:hypothetical protein